MRFLVDANVLSEQTKPRPNQKAIDWLFKNDAQIGLNPIILGELEFGILTLPAGRKRRALLDWFAGSVELLPVLQIDAGTASAWANLVASLRKRGLAMPVKDSLVAATALQHGLTVATRNVADYRVAGVKLVNPFDD